MTKHTPRQRPQRSAEGDSSLPGERLQKVLAAAGLGSRRGCEELITAGRVEVDRQVVTELGTRVDPVRQEIRVDGEVLKQPKTLYYAVNKPMGVVTTNFDPAGRPRVIDLVPTDQRVFAVGRLDRASEGLILVTNDGEFANRITHPRYGVEKTYLVRVAGAPSEAELMKLRKGVYLSDGFVRAQSVVVKRSHGQSTDLVIVLNEGRNREIRRILARVGHKVLRLKRVAVGPVKLGDLPVGNWRRLMPPEIESLLAAAKERKKRGGQAHSPAGPRSPSKRNDAAAVHETGDEDSPVPEGRGEGAAEGPGHPRGSEYLQKDALLAEPLSLDELLRDDLDEGPLPVDSGEVEDLDEYAFDDAPAGRPGGVIDFGGDDQPSAAEGEPAGQQAPRSDRGRRGFRERGARQGGRRTERTGNRAESGRRDRRPDGSKAEGGARDREALPRESYGRKRGGKRVFARSDRRRSEERGSDGRRSDGRRPAGEKSGSFRFRKRAADGPRPFRRPEEPSPESQTSRDRSGTGKSSGAKRKFARKGGQSGKKFGRAGAKPYGRRNEAQGGRRGEARFKKPSGNKFQRGGRGKKGRS